MLLMIVSTTAMTVLHSVEVVHIPHESQLSLLVRHPLIRWSTFTHFWGVNPDHQGPPLAPCGSQESPLHYPLIPIQTDP
jgi:hypothetical protein